MTNEKYEMLRPFFERHSLRYELTNGHYEIKAATYGIEAAFVPVFKELLVAEVPVNGDSPRMINVANKELARYVERLVEELKTQEGTSLEMLVA